MTSNTYVSDEESYTNEEFILLNIYPKTNGTVSITYGDLTKTIIDTSGEAEPASQEVYFGTYHGAVDSTPSSGTLIISGDYNNFTVGTFDIDKNTIGRCDCIEAITNWGTIHTILPSGFMKQTKLTEINLSKINTISSDGFNGCSNLINIIFSKRKMSIGYSAFKNCIGLTNIIMPNCIETKYEASRTQDIFNSCTNLKSITIPSYITYLTGAFFSNCVNLNNIVIDDKNQYYSTNGTIIFDKTQSTIIAYPSVSGVYTLPENIKLSESCFQEAKNLTEIIIPSSITHIPKKAFFQCTGLTSAILAEGVENIDAYAFAFCGNNFTNVSLPHSIITINDYAFNLNPKLTLDKIPNNLTTIGANAFTACTAITDFVMSNNVKTIGEGAFANCSGLSTVMLSSQITKLEPYTFQYCHKISNITIPNTITSLGKQAVEIIDNDDTTTQTIIMLSTIPPSIQRDTFVLPISDSDTTVTVTGMNIIVPKGCSSRYKTATNWTLYADYITEAS